MPNAEPSLRHTFHKGRQGPVLLLVHGFLSSSAQWAANIEGLTAFCSPVVVDLWGHGASPAPEEPEHYRPAGYFRQFEKLREALGVESWAICGASFGAGLTMQYALACARRVRRQIITNSISGFSQATSDPDDREARASAIEAGGAAGLSEMPFHPRFAKRLAPSVAAALMTDAARLDPRGVANAIRHTTPSLSAAATFGETRTPTLLVNGVWEKAFQPVRAFALARLPTLQIADLEGGHSINAEAPEAFNEAVRAFLAQD